MEDLLTTNHSSSKITYFLHGEPNWYSTFVFILDISQSYAVTTKLVLMKIDFQLGNWVIQPLKDSIDASFIPTVADFKKVSEYPKFKLYEAINSQPFFNKNLDKCGVDYHIWNEGTFIRPVTMKLEVKGG